MNYENVCVQLIDLPPVTADHFENFVAGITYVADAAILFLNLAYDGPAATRRFPPAEARTSRTRSAGHAAHRRSDGVRIPTLVVTTKGDDEAADIRPEIAREEFGTRFPLHDVSAKRGDELEEFRTGAYDVLSVVRIYTK